MLAAQLWPVVFATCLPGCVFNSFQCVMRLVTVCACWTKHKVTSLLHNSCLHMVCLPGMPLGPFEQPWEDLAAVFPLCCCLLLCFAAPAVLLLLAVRLPAAAQGPGNAAVVQLLLDAGADVNARTASEATAMHIAACSNSGSVVRVLVQAGGNARDNRAYKGERAGVGSKAGSPPRRAALQ